MRLDRHLRASETVPPSSNPPWRGWVSRLSPKASHFRGRNLRHFWSRRACLGYGSAPTPRQAVGRGRLTCIPGAPGPASSSLRGPSPLPQALTLLGRASFIAWLPSGPEAFLKLPGVSGLRPCSQTHLKKSLCHTRPVGGTCDKYRLNAALLLRRSYLVSRNQKQDGYPNSNNTVRKFYYCCEIYIFTQKCRTFNRFLL